MPNIKMKLIDLRQEKTVWQQRSQPLDPSMECTHYMLHQLTELQEKLMNSTLLVCFDKNYIYIFHKYKLIR